jgi:predicted N-acetyltransferase YhbS
VPAADAQLVDAWHRLCFGEQHAYGIQELEAEPWPEGVREAELRDVDALVELAPLIRQQHGLSPVFAPNPQPETEDELRAEIESELASDEVGNLVAEVDGRVVGNFLVVPVERSSGHRGLARPEGACLLGFAATVPEVRGSGLGVALAQAALAWAHRAGYRTMVTDWRVTNLLSSRFFPRRDFRLTFLRMYRSIP